VAEVFFHFISFFEIFWYIYVEKRSPNWVFMEKKEIFSNSLNIFPN
jgi:hypothetical protein